MDIDTDISEYWQLGEAAFGVLTMLRRVMFKAGGRLPNDDKVLARSVGMAMPKWRKYREALEDFFTVEDGFLTDPQIAEALAYLEQKYEKIQRKTSAGGEAKSLKSNETGLLGSRGNKNIEEERKKIPTVSEKESPERALPAVGPASASGWLEGFAPLPEDPRKAAKGTKAVAHLIRDEDLMGCVAEWHRLAGLHKGRIADIRHPLTEQRRVALRRLLADYGVAGWGDALAEIDESDFLNGRSGSWAATFDWLVKRTNFVKVIEGNYRNKPKPEVRRAL